MRTFEKAFKIPFKVESEDLPYRILDADGNFAFELRVDTPAKAVEGILAVINGVMGSKVVELDVELTDGEIHLGGHFLLRLRGWGYLTGIGGLNLTAEEAASIQDDLGNYIVGKLKGL